MRIHETNFQIRRPANNLTEMHHRTLTKLAMLKNVLPSKIQLEYLFIYTESMTNCRNISHKQ